MSAALVVGVDSSTSSTKVGLRELASVWSLDAGVRVEPDPEVDGAALRAAYRDAAARSG